MYSLDDVGVICCLGFGKQALVTALLDTSRKTPSPAEVMTERSGLMVGEIAIPLKNLGPDLARFDCRNNRLAAAAISQIRDTIDHAIERYGRDRIGVVMATSTSGIAESEKAVRSLQVCGKYPSGYHAKQGILGGLGEFVAKLLQLQGPVYTMSTACSSSANAALSVRRLIRANLCDAVLFGGVDSLCEMTLKGFGSLEAESAYLCKPFTAERDGINIGEAAAVFLMTSDGNMPHLRGGAGSSDAYHISAPQPEGEGAAQAMYEALQDAGLEATDIDYINLHGTGTFHNDLMESRAVNRIFGNRVPCSSTKSLTGHTLGAAGALELAICWLILDQKQQCKLPPALYQEDYDPDLPPLMLVGTDTDTTVLANFCLSNSFAFGGSNVSLILGRSGHGKT